MILKYTDISIFLYIINKVVTCHKIQNLKHQIFFKFKYKFLESFNSVDFVFLC